MKLLSAISGIIRVRLLLLLLALGCTTAATAQLRYGFRFGGEFAAASLKNAAGYRLENRSGFSGGLALEYQVPVNGLAADIAVLYTRYNTRIANPGEDNLHSFGRNFIEVPIHLKYKFWLHSTKDLFGPLVYTGPSFMMAVGSKSDNPLSTKRFQPGWDVGIGFDIINFIQITGGYRFGLGNAVDAFSAAPDATLRTNGWNISATLLFDF